MASSGPLRLAVLTNPRARRNRRNPARVDALSALLGDLGEVFAPDGFDELHSVLQELRLRGAQILVVDGTRSACGRIQATDEIKQRGLA